MSDITQRYSTGAPQNLEQRFASRAAHMKPSEIRSLFAVASRPEIVSLAGGMPNLSALPMGMMADVVDNLIRNNGQEALQYGNGQGHPKLREQICEVMALEGIRANPDDVLITTGSQQALDLISRIFLDPQDVVLAEAPSYVGALGHFHTAKPLVHYREQDYLQHQPSFPLDALKDLAFHPQVKQFQDVTQQQRENESHLASCVRLERQIFLQDFVEHLSSSVA